MEKWHRVVGDRAKVSAFEDVVSGTGLATAACPDSSPAMAATLDRHWHLQVAARGAKQGWLLVALSTKGRLILPNGQAIARETGILAIALM